MTTPEVAATITLSDNGFSPASVTIKKGQAVQWVNEGSGTMWIGSADHPTHTVYSGTTLRGHCPDESGTAFDQCGTGNSYTFVFEKAGTWHYHNHVKASQTGTVLVTE